MKKPRKFSLGLDFGTESGRAVLIDISNGDMVATAVHKYKSGVIDQFLPSRKKTRLPPDWALQDPHDYLDCIKRTVPQVLKLAKAKSEDIIGIGIDFTACTILPTKSDGTPLCALPDFKDDPHSWTKLWKHHSAQPYADRINRIAQERNEPFLARYGSKISSEWMFPKIMEIAENSPKVYDAADKIMEAQDWVVWQLTGTESRSSCAAGYKALWSKTNGYPDSEFFQELNPGMARTVFDKVGSAFRPPGHRAGNLTPSWAKCTGLKAGTPVAVPIIDAHSAVLGCGVSEPNEMVICLGTSTCHLLLSKEERLLKGISGVVEDGIVPGYFGYEAGQAAVGDLFAWAVKNCAPAGLARKDGKVLYEKLEKEAAKMRPGESGLLALDWWNGNRSVLVDSGLTGMMLGMTLNTKSHEIYRALIESTAMGTLRIIQEFESEKIPIRKLHATGGISEKTTLLLQIYADVTGRDLEVTEFPQVSALGAAVLGAVSAGSQAGFCSVPEATRHMTRSSRKLYRPDPQSREIYSKIYREYTRLHDYFGLGDNDVMKKLREIKTTALKSRN